MQLNVGVISFVLVTRYYYLGNAFRSRGCALSVDHPADFLNPLLSANFVLVDRWKHQVFQARARPRSPAT